MPAVPLTPRVKSEEEKAVFSRRDKKRVMIALFLHRRVKNAPIAQITENIRLRRTKYIDFFAA